ncbi:unnamed protein product [Rhizophagus irregularis]|nr:unnamed protein product [Rhizophagus irregularis]
MVQKVRVITKKQQREVILCLWNEGVCNASEIQRRTSIGLSTIYYNLKKLEKTGDTAQKPGQGRPKKITDIGARVIGQQIRRYPTVSTNDLTLTLLEKGITVSRHTVGRHLHNYGYKNSLPLAVPMLTAKQKQKRSRPKSIENLWALTKRNVEKRQPKNLDELELFMIEEWHEISDEIINNLVRSMKKRCEEIIRVNGERINF